MRFFLSGGMAPSVCMLCRRSASFDEDDADVLDHRQHHLAEALGLRFGVAAELNLVEFADAVHEQRDFAAELLFDFVQRSRRILDRIVQNRRGYRLRVQVHLGELLRDRDGMRYVGFAGLARLPEVRLRAEFVGGRDFPELFFRQIGLQRLDESPHAVVAPVGAGQFRQYGCGVVHAPIIPADRGRCR